MKKTNSILLALRMLGYQGGKILSNRWLPLVDGVRQSLAKSGFEQPESSDELLLFTFPHPFSALTALLESLRTSKEEHGWKESHGSLPVQIVFHLIEEDDAFPQISQPSAAEWEMLQLETLYVTRTLMRQWPELMAGRDLPEHSFEDEGSGFFHMIFAAGATIRQVELFPYRSLPVRGKEKECFYCGMTSHLPAGCPSKFLTMQTRGLDKIGYLPFAELSATYKNVFPDYSACMKKIAAGLKPGQIRKDNELLVFIAYLDLNAIYQLRFLQHIAFSPSSKWNGLDKADKITIDSRNLHMGLDCLRVGQYEKAEEILLAESKRREGKPFFALMGLAFRALEQGRDKDMAHYLERAKTIAAQEKERFYIQLLLSRFYELQHDSWKAKESIANAEKILFDAPECQYRKMQYNIRYGFVEEDFKRLRSLMIGQKEIFMAALMDPLLLSIQGLINDLAIRQVEQQQQGAGKKLELAEAEFAELGYWLDDDDPIIQENNLALGRLREKFAGQSYYDLLEVIDRGAGIISRCQRIRKTKLEEQEKRKVDLDAQLQRHLQFWQAYPYQNYFNSYLQTLTEIKKTLAEAQVQIAREKGQAFKAAANLLDRADISVTSLQQIQEKMMWTRILLNSLKIFVKNIMITELALFVAGFLIFLIVPILLPGDHTSGLGKIISDPLLRKKSLLLSSFLLAPFVAIVWTVWNMKDEQ